MACPVPEDRIDEMADAAAEAFIAADDPVCRFLFEEEPGSLDLTRAYFRMIARECQELSIQRASSPAMEAVAIWFPPGVDYSKDKGEDPFTHAAFASPKTRERIEATFSLLARMTAILRDEPQWYLHLVACRPAFQGQGLASALIRPVLEEADRCGLPCSLVTQGSKNVRMYERLGFRVARAAPIPHSEVILYSMRRDPISRSPSPPAPR